MFHVLRTNRHTTTMFSQEVNKSKRCGNNLLSTDITRFTMNQFPPGHMLSFSTGMFPLCACCMKYMQITQLESCPLDLSTDDIVPDAHCEWMTKGAGQTRGGQQIVLLQWGQVIIFSFYLLLFCTTKTYHSFSEEMQCSSMNLSYLISTRQVSPLVFVQLLLKPWLQPLPPTPKHHIHFQSPEQPTYLLQP